MNNEETKTPESEVVALKSTVKGLVFAVGALVVCTLALSYGMWQQNKAIVSVSGSAEQLAGTVEVMIKNEQITSQMRAEFDEWATTDEGKQWIDEYLANTWDPANWSGEYKEEE